MLDSEIPRFFLGRTLIEHSDRFDFQLPSSITGCDGGGTGGVLMQHLVKRGSYYAGLMLILHSCYTRNSHLARTLFSQFVVYGRNKLYT